MKRIFWIPSCLLLSIFMLPACSVEKVERIQVERLSTNPIITGASSATLRDKINGPSLIRVPSWVKNPLGKYYLYFGHHKGNFIRLAYSDTIEGPWRIYEPGTIHLEEATSLEDHIASPDVHIDEENKRGCPS